MSKNKKFKPCIKSLLKEDGTYGLQVQGIFFENVNVYEDKYGAFCVSDCSKEIPKTAKIIWCIAKNPKQTVVGRL